MTEPNEPVNEEEHTNLELQEMEELKEFLTNVCESLCLDTVEKKPKDISYHMINFLHNKYRYSSSGLQYDEKKELEKLRDEVELFREMDEHTYYSDQQKQVKKEVKQTEKKSKVPPKPKPRLPPEEQIVSDDEDYNNEEEIDENLDNVEFIQNCNLNNKRSAVTENTLSEQDEESQIKFHKKNSDIVEFMRISLMKSPLFSELPLPILKQCIDAMEEKNIPAVTDVVKQGEIGDCFYFIVEGDLECKMQFIKVTKEGNRKKVEKFEPKLVKVYGPGDYFGELSLLYQTPRRGTIKTVTDVKAYVLNRTNYKKILKNAKNENMTKKINIFKKVPILQTLTDEEYEKLEKISKEAIYYKGETILKQNEFCNAMLIIDKGKCIGTQTEEEGKIPVKIRDYKEGDIIGEGALLKPEKQQENIIVDTDIVKFICVDRFSFRSNFGSLEQMLMRNLDLYYEYFPPIVEEKPEEKNEKEDNDKSNQDKSAQNNQSQQPNEAPKMNESPSTNNINNNTNNNTVNVDEIIKKIKNEADEEKKKMEMKQNEEIEKLKQQIAQLQNEKNELMKSATFNNQNNQPILVSNMVESNPNEDQTKLRSIKNSQNSQNQEANDIKEGDNENKPQQNEENAINENGDNNNNIKDDKANDVNNETEINKNQDENVLNNVVNEEDENKPQQTLVEKITYQPEEIEKEKENALEEAKEGDKENVKDNAQENEQGNVQESAQENAKENIEQPKVEQEGSPNENIPQNEEFGGFEQ